MDADTGAFLYSKNMDAREYPASITKIMTALIARWKTGNFELQDRFFRRMRSITWRREVPIREYSLGRR